MIIKRAPAGFTLIEMMVAVALLAIISVLVFSSIRAAFTSFEAISLKSKSQSKFASTFSIINDDLVNLVARPIRVDINKQEGAFLAEGFESEYLIEFTRGGLQVINTDGVQLKSLGLSSPQIGLARIAYKFADETLYRYEWGILDTNIKDTAFEKENTLLEDVSDVQVLTYSLTRAKALQEETRWPATSLSTRNSKKELLQLPAAVSLLIKLKDGKEFFLFFPGSNGV